MKRRNYHHHHHHHFHERHTLKLRKQGGFIKRTIKGLARKFNVSRRTIIIGFVVLFIFTKIFALLAFFLAYHWVKNPGKYEDMFDATLEKTRRGFDDMKSRSEFADPVMAAGPGATYEPEYDFSDLRQKFDDLEKRTNGMEEHVSSEEYKLNKEFENI